RIQGKTSSLIFSQRRATAVVTVWPHPSLRDSKPTVRRSNYERDRKIDRCHWVHRVCMVARGERRIYYDGQSGQCRCRRGGGRVGECRLFHGVEHRRVEG